MLNYWLVVYMLLYNVLHWWLQWVNCSSSYLLYLHKYNLSVTASKVYNTYIFYLKLQSWTKLLEKVFPIMSTLLCNKAISKMTPLQKENPFPQSNVAFHKHPGIRLSLDTQQHCFQGKGEREEPVQVLCLEKCCPSIQFSQQFCPRLCTGWFAFSRKNICKDKTKTC